MMRRWLATIALALALAGCLPGGDELLRFYCKDEPDPERCFEEHR